MRAMIAIVGLLVLAGCAAEAPIDEQPTMYADMANRRRQARCAGRGDDDFAVPAE